MNNRLIFIIPAVLLLCLFFSVNAFAATDSDIEILVLSPVNSLQNESGVVAVEQFPASIQIKIAAQKGILTKVQMDYNGQSQSIASQYTLTVGNKEVCGPYTINAKTDEGAILTITFNVVFQTRAIYDVRYRTIGMNITEIYEVDTLLKSFREPQRINLVNANTVAEHEKKKIAGWIGSCDGGTYTLKGSLVVEIHNASTGHIYGSYDTDTAFASLTEGYGWTEKTVVAFETMRNTALSYQAPVNIDVQATWCDEGKEKIYGTLTAQDKGIPSLLYPYQTTAVTFSKDDIRLSPNLIYCGLEWDYSPETEEYTDGESKTQTSVTQKIHYRIPAAHFYFKFKEQDGNDLSVAIHAPARVIRGSTYSFTVVYMNSGKSQAYDVPLKGTIDNAAVKEIPSVQDFPANTSKTYTIRRTADTAENEIHLWDNIGVPEGFVDGNLSNNTATVIIKIIDPEPDPTPGPDTPENPKNPDNPDNPDKPDKPDDPVNPPDDPPELPELCDLSASIIAPPTVYEHETYSYTMSFTNYSDKQLKAVLLKGKNNDKALDRITEISSFKPNETKSFTIESAAGSADEVYSLWANVGIPDGYADENPSNNTAASSIKVVKRIGDDPDDPPKKPDDPPDKPDDPQKPQCDLWVNLSAPPSVYEQENFSFTVYFANSTNTALSGVAMEIAINGRTVSTVPAASDFKAFEKKSFLITGSSGQKGETIRLSAKVSPPVDYVDTNTSNNKASEEITVLERPYDLDVQRITPDRYKENQSVITTIKVSNTGSLDFTPGQKVTVLFQIPELSLSKRLEAVVMEKETWNVVSLRWDTPNVQEDKSITLIAVINPQDTLKNESTMDNNTYTRKAVIENVAYETPTERMVLPTPPQRNEQPRVTWWEQRYENGQFVWKQFHAELKVTARLDYETKSKGYLKSGYGYSITVTTAVSTNYDRPELITAPQTVEIYLPEHQYEFGIPLVREDGKFVFNKNPASPLLYRKQYIPIWFPDNRDYIMQLLVTDVHTPGGTLSRWITGGELKIHVVDSMYSDDVTTGN